MSGGTSVAELAKVVIVGKLSGKVVFITGTAGGQGRAAALLFAKEGAHIVACDVKEEQAEETVTLVREAGGRIDSFIVDLTRLSSATQWIEDGIRETGRIDVLYNNAGNPRMAFMGEQTEEIWSHTIRGELDIIFNTVRPAWNHFVAQGKGVILNTASVSGHRGYAPNGQTAHAAAKAGVLGLTRQLAAEGAAHRIRVNSISPGAIITPALDVLSPDQLQKLHDMNPLGRAGKPEDIAYCALYLASDEAEWVTGADFVIDGGVNAMLAG